jgi:hypothetical protein
MDATVHWPRRRFRTVREAAVSTLAIIAILVIAVFVGLIVLRLVASLALAFFWPLLLITIGIGIGVWWMSRRGTA